MPGGEGNVSPAAALPLGNEAPVSGLSRLLPPAVLLLVTLCLTLWASDWLAVTTAIADQLLHPQAYIHAVLGETP